MYVFGDNQTQPSCMQTWFMATNLFIIIIINSLTIWPSYMMFIYVWEVSKFASTEWPKTECFLYSVPKLPKIQMEMALRNNKVSATFHEHVDRFKVVGSGCLVCR